MPLETKRPLKAMPILRMISIVDFFLVILGDGSCTKADLTPQPTATSTQSSTPLALPAEFMDDQGITMSLVPAGEFTMGSDNDSDNRNQAHRVYLDAFYMDAYEVTNVRYADCVTAGVCEPPHFTKSDFRTSYYGDPEYDNFPVIYVDWTMARTYCE